METRDKRTWAEIDLGSLKHNYYEIKKKLPEGTGIVGLCKANAYGHGAVPVARRLETLGAEMLAVSCYEEAAELRSAGIKADIIILAPSLPFLAADVAEMDVIQTVGDIDCARRMSAALEGKGKALRIHVKLDTGMGRTGFDVDFERSYEEIRELLELPNLKVEGVFTHFAVADEPEQESYTLMQFEKFRKAVERVEAETGRSLGVRHCANSGAVVNYPQTAMDMVRPGLLLYGIYPGAERSGLDLRPVMTLKTRVCEITEHKAGDTISYGRMYTCERDCRLAVVPIGYADGLHRCASGKLSMLLGDKRVEQVGRVCMDMCMLDVTELPDAKVGDVVTVFGRDPGVDELAKKAGTVSYELLCAVSPRVERVYIG